MTIYRSPRPEAPVPLQSTYTQIFRSEYFQNIPQDTVTFIDPYTGKTLTRNDVFVLTRKLAWGLREELHKLGGVSLTRGDTVMLLSGNSIAWPIVLYGAVAAGIKVSPANPGYTAAELLYQYEDSGAKAVVVQPTAIPIVLEMFKIRNVSEAEARKHIIVIDWASTATFPKGYVGVDELMSKGIMETEEAFDGDLAEETVFICYSSGTTGKPKGVETTHKNINVMLHVGPVEFPQLTPKNKDVMLNILPFFHIFGIVSVINTPLVLGIPLVIMSHFDFVDMCRFIEKHQVTTSLIVPPVCLAFANHPATTKFNLKSLKYLLSGAAPLGEVLVLATRNKLRSVGAEVYVFQGYGMTETSPTVTVQPHHSFLTKVGSIGVLVPSWELRLVTEEEEDVEEGERGEMWLRGPGVMKGYINNKEATENTITKDGWLKTGDIAIRDSDGYYFIVDRKKELIKYKGFQVAPAELEAILLSHPGIADAAVIGIEGEGTELPRAYIVVHKKPESPAEANTFIKEIHQWLSTRVAKYKYLRGGIVIIDVIPKSAAGKILRKDLRQMANTERDLKAKL